MYECVQLRLIRAAEGLAEGALEVVASVTRDVLPGIDKTLPEARAAIAEQRTETFARSDRLVDGHRIDARHRVFERCAHARDDREFVRLDIVEGFLQRVFGRKITSAARTEHLRERHVYIGEKLERIVVAFFNQSHGDTRLAFCHRA